MVKWQDLLPRKGFSFVANPPRSFLNARILTLPEFHALLPFSVGISWRYTLDLEEDKDVERIHLDRGLRDREDLLLDDDFNGDACVLLCLRTVERHFVAVGLVVGRRLGSLEVNRWLREVLQSQMPDGCSWGGKE